MSAERLTKLGRRWPPTGPESGPGAVPFRIELRTPLDIQAEIKALQARGDDLFWYEGKMFGQIVISTLAGRFIAWTCDGVRVSGRFAGLWDGGPFYDPGLGSDRHQRPRLYVDMATGNGLRIGELVGMMLTEGVVVGIDADAVWHDIAPAQQTPLRFVGSRVGLYKRIIADPPWNESGGGKIKRGANRHYPLMKTRDICALPVGMLCSPEGAHLYLWATNNFMEDAYRVARAWGFRPLGLITWRKDRQGLGQYFRGMTEHVLFAVRGNLPYKFGPDGKRLQGVTFIKAARRKHSEKPPSLRRMAARVSHDPGIELFARDPVPGLDSWGNEKEMEHLQSLQLIPQPPPPPPARQCSLFGDLA